MNVAVGFNSRFADGYAPPKALGQIHVAYATWICPFGIMVPIHLQGERRLSMNLPAAGVSRRTLTSSQELFPLGNPGRAAEDFKSVFEK